MLTAIVFAAFVGICLALMRRSWRLRLFHTAICGDHRIDSAGVLPFCAIGLFIGVVASAQAAQAITTIVYMVMMFFCPRDSSVDRVADLSSERRRVWPLFHLSKIILPSAPEGSTDASVSMFAASLELRFYSTPSQYADFGAN